MTWLISLFLASAMLAPNVDSAARLSYEKADVNTNKVVKFDETERFEQTYALNSNGRVSVSNVNGSITIDTWDNAQVKLEYVKTADSRERLADATVKIDARGDALRVETVYDNERQSIRQQWKNNGKLYVEYRLTVPRTAILDQIETVNGSINIANAANTTKASAVNGEIRATNLRGTANLSTVNGTVQADFDRLAANGRISLETVNGTVNLTIPSDADATVKADTVNGSIVNDFGLPVRKGQYVGKDLYGRIGAGATQIKLSSVNGGLSVKRRNDGKNISPTQNLLTPKSRADGDFDNDGEAFVDTEKLNRNIEKARAAAEKEIHKNAAQINRETARALADSRKEIAGSGAEIEKALELAKIELAGFNVEKITAEALRSAGFNSSFAGAPNVEKRSGSFAVKGVPNVAVEAKNCRVTVRGWDKPEVSYSVVKITESNNNSTLNISAVNDAASVTIKVTNADNTAGGNLYNDSSRVRVEIFVPRKSDLKIVGSGEIRLEGVTGTIDLQGADDAVNVRDAGGKLSVETGDGSIRVVGFRGAFDGKTVDGTMNIEGDFQSFNASAIDGSIILTLPENANALLESNIRIETEGVNLTPASATSWRVGVGGALYKMNVADGKVFVRSVGAIKTN